MCKSESYVLDASFNPEEFVEDIKKAKAAVGEATEEDAQHLQRLVLISQVLLYGGHVLLLVGAALPFGVATLMVCSVGAGMIAFARCMKWAIIGHHVSHGGYDALQKNHPNALPSHYKRGVFAIGMRRFFDWLDWMLPQAWDVEHNKAHHYYLSEEKDPDLVEHNFELLRKFPLPKVMKYFSMLLWVFTWKFTYYSPNTYKELALSKKDSWLARHWPSWGKKTDPVVVFDIFRMPAMAVMNGKPLDAFYWWAFFAEWSLAILPMMISVALPALWPILLGRAGLWFGATSINEAALRLLVTSVIADMLSNAHAFVIIACNHSGGDLYRYSTSCKAYSAEFLLRCAYSSANFECGNDLIDIVYGWLNYQVEHHMFPDMTPLQYRKFQPLVKSICKKHGVMYVQENALKRTWMMFQVAVGDAAMKQCTALVPPQAYGKVAESKVAGGWDEKKTVDSPGWTYQGICCFQKHLTYRPFQIDLSKSGHNLWISLRLQFSVLEYQHIAVCLCPALDFDCNCAAPWAEGKKHPASAHVTAEFFTTSIGMEVMLKHLPQINSWHSDDFSSSLEKVDSLKQHCHEVGIMDKAFIWSLSCTSSPIFSVSGMADPPLKYLRSFMFCYEALKWGFPKMVVPPNHPF